MKKWVLFGLLMHGLFNNSKLIADEIIPESMAALGDSISAGALAKYSRTDARNPLVDLTILFKIAGAFMTSNYRFIENRDFSWSLGMDSRLRMISHAKRLSFMKGRKINTYNAAVSGNESADLQDQFDRILKWSYKNNNAKFPDYITLLIGPNDICAERADDMVNPDTFKNNVEDIIHDIHEKNPRAKILVSSLPNIERLRSVAKASTLMGIAPFKTCEDLWRRAKQCGTLTMIDDPIERSKVSLRVKEYNSVLQKLASVGVGLELEQDFQSTDLELSDPKNSNVRFGEKVYDVNFTPDDLSLDCFHPNPKGQNLISDMTWKSSWWYNDWQKNYAKAFDDYVKKEKRRIAIADQRAREAALRSMRGGR